MNGFLSLFALFLVGFLIQVVVATISPCPWFCPHVILIMTITCGLFRGPLSAESLGFSWGLALDAMGMTAFGAQGLALCWVGYLSGVLSRWVALEEPVSQMTLSLFGSLFYFCVLHFLESTLGGAGRSWSFGLMMSACLFNVVAAPFVFLAFEKWVGFSSMRPGARY